jgi:threonine/homoserine efflux transporter RhtA
MGETKEKQNKINWMGVVVAVVADVLWRMALKEGRQGEWHSQKGVATTTSSVIVTRC